MPVRPMPPLPVPEPNPMKKTSPLSVTLAFLVVALPLSWGIYRSIKNSMPLFAAGKMAPSPGATAAAPK